MKTPANSSEFVIYIKAFSNDSKAGSVSLTVQEYDRPIITLHNQEHVYVYDPTDNSIGARSSGSVEYEYHTTNSFYIFV